MPVRKEDEVAPSVAACRVFVTAVFYCFYVFINICLSLSSAH